jgi:hypothetical protein
MDALARHSPREFEKLICSVRLMPVKGNRIPPGSFFLVKQRGHVERTRNMELHTDTESFVTGDFYYYLPLPYFAGARQLKLFDHVCNRINSVSIFNSEAGKMILSLSWLSYGVHGHLMAMGMYAVFGALALVDIFLFSLLKDDLAPLYYAIAASELAMDAYYLRQEANQFIDDPRRYFTHVWNWLVRIDTTDTIDTVIVITPAPATCYSSYAIWHTPVSTPTPILPLLSLLSLLPLTRSFLDTTYHIPHTTYPITHIPYHISHIPSYRTWW